MTLAATRLSTEHQACPQGLNEPVPRLSWAVAGGGRDRRQTAYRIRAGLAPGAADLWDSGRVASAESLLIPWGGAALASDITVHWSVELWDEAGRAGPPCPAASFHTGLMRPQDWQAQWIARPWLPPGGQEPPSDSVYDNPWRARPADYLRRGFTVDRPVARATVYATALGVYELRLNGRAIGDQVLAPGWTDYHTRVEVQRYDVTAALRTGANVLAAILGEGWYCGRVGTSPRRAGAHYGGRPAFLAQLHIVFADGGRAVVATDAGWSTTNQAIVYSDLLLGEKYDARLEQPGWDAPGFDDAAWLAVEPIEPRPRAPRLDAARAQPVRKLKEFPARLLHRAASGALVFDIGQNLAGHVRLAVADAPAGAAFVLRHAEVLDAGGELYVANLKTAVATDHFVAAAGPAVFEPRFTFHGFRYVELALPPGVAPEAVTLTGVAVHSDTPEAGRLRTGHALVNQLVSNIEWSQRGNFLSVPTDCPQRDERLGWTADAQLFLRTAGYAMDVAAFFTKWLVDLADAQFADGAFPDVAPSKPHQAFRFEPPKGAPAWGDGAVTMPWQLYRRYGDRELVERHYPALLRWMDYIERHNPDLVRVNAVHGNYGDWLSVGPAAPKDMVATAYWAHIADCMAKMARLLGRRTDAAHFSALFGRLCDSFRGRFVDADGRIAGDTQTGYLLALDFGLLDEARRGSAAAHLLRCLDAAGGRLQTGFLGLKHLCPVLSELGHAERAFALLLAEDYPSWGFSIRHGATTIWERWDGWTEARGFQSANMNSFNHYAYGAVGEWLWARVAGVDDDEADPGFRTVRLRPLFHRALGWVEAEHLSPRGPIASAWRCRDGGVDWQVTLPANTAGAVELPVPPDAIRLDGAPLADGVAGAVAAGGITRFRIGSGRYEFSIAHP